MTIIRTKRAEDDIKGIYKYSFLNFGEEQAEKYYEGLQRKFKSIFEKTAHSTDYSFIEKTSGALSTVVMPFFIE